MKASIAIIPLLIAARICIAEGNFDATKLSKSQIAVCEHFRLNPKSRTTADSRQLCSLGILPKSPSRVNKNTIISDYDSVPVIMSRKDVTTLLGSPDSQNDTFFYYRLKERGCIAIQFKDGHVVDQLWITAK